MSDERNQGLRVRTTRFALGIIKLCASLPAGMTGQVLGRQLLRSGTSVGAQYREATRAKSAADFVSKIEGALQELEETAYWLELLIGSGVVKRSQVDLLIAECGEITAMLVASAKTAKKKTVKKKSDE
jgi:four helix bundle protein